VNRVAILAEIVGDHGIVEGAGVARFARLDDEPDVAEVAIAVIDERQRLGLGHVLLNALVDAARTRGIQRFRAMVLHENAPLRAPLEDVAEHFTMRVEDGCLIYDIPLTDDRTEPSATSVLGRFLAMAAGGLQFVMRALAGDADAPTEAR